MSTYIMLANWTDQGARNITDSPRRLDASTPRRLDASTPPSGALENVGGQFKAFFMTMGEFDMVAVYEAPDDAVAARFTLEIGQLGNIRTRTLKAFPETAYREIIASLR